MKWDGRQMGRGEEMTCQPWNKANASYPRSHLNYLDLISNHLNTPGLLRPLDKTTPPPSPVNVKLRKVKGGHWSMIRIQESDSNPHNHECSFTWLSWFLFCFWLTYLSAALYHSCGSVTSWHDVTLVSAIQHFPSLSFSSRGAQNWTNQLLSAPLPVL